MVLAEGHPPRRRPVELAAREAGRALGRDRRPAAPARGALHAGPRPTPPARTTSPRPTCRRPPPRPGSTPSGWPSRSSAGTRRSTGSSISKRPRSTRSSSSTRGSGCSATTSASTRCAACRGTRGSSRCGRRCCRTRRCSRCSGRCTRGTRTCCPPPWATPGCSPSTSASPCSGREGANIAIVRRAPRTETETGGVYGAEGYVYQLFDPLPEFDGYRPALGAWVVGRRGRRAGHPRDRGPDHRQRRGLRPPPHPRLTD